MAKKVLISAVVCQSGVTYNRLVSRLTDGMLDIRPVDHELSETEYINGLLLCCPHEALPFILSTIRHTSGGIDAKCRAILCHHSHLLLPPSLSATYIYNLHTDSLLPLLAKF